jgi:glucose-6-phosphate isomerase
MKKLQIDFNNMLAENIGAHGLTTQEIKQVTKDTQKVYEGLEAKRTSTTWRELAFNQADIIADIKKTGDMIKDKFDAFVVFGIGGSALGSKALFSSLKHLHHNELPAEKRGCPRFYVSDNVDPDKMNALFDVLDVKKTAFHVISKSGNTVETLSQFAIVLDRLKKELGDNYKDNIVITTDKENGNMKRIADENAFKTFIVPDGVGGRFSVFSPVGLLSCAVLDIDIDALLKGAGDMDTMSRTSDLSKNPAFMYAAMYVAAMKKGANISVVMPYADGLLFTAEWYAQLWAESLGKQVDNDGNTVNYGQTPVRALGVTDQHSQVQLYNEGPFDKVITFIKVANTNTSFDIPTAPINLHEADYLQGQSLNKLILAELSATEYAVTTHGKMNMMITLDTVDAYTVGMLLSFYQVATAAAGEYLNIDAFDQPGVEAGKIATFALMGREGYEKTREELSKQVSKNMSYVFDC